MQPWVVLQLDRGNLVDPNVIPPALRASIRRRETEAAERNNHAAMGETLYLATTRGGRILVKSKDHDVIVFLGESNKHAKKVPENATARPFL